MVTLKKKGKQGKNEENPTAAESGKEVVTTDSDNNIQEATKSLAAKRDTRNKDAAEAPERKSRRGEKEPNTEEAMEETAEEPSDKKINGRKRKADQKESEDVQEKESQLKKSKQAKEFAASSEDQNSQNGSDKVQPEKEPAAAKTQKGRKKHAESDRESEMSSDKASASGDNAAEEVKATKKGRGAPKGKQEKDTEDSEDVEAMDTLEADEAAADKDGSRAKGAKKGAKNPKAGKEQKKDAVSETEPPTANVGIEKTGNKADAKPDRKVAETSKAAKGKNKDVESEEEPDKEDDKVKETLKEEGTKTKPKAKENTKDSNRNAAKKGVKNANSAQGAGDDAADAEPPKKKARVVAPVASHSSHRTTPGVVLTVGAGDTGQLGLGPDVMERGKPGKVEMPAGTVQVCAGGMHSVCLTVDGEVYTFGCNDEGSLGRPTEEEEECMEPGKVNLPAKIVLVSAGDSHTAALSELGEVYIWGTFRDVNGSIGIFPGREKIEKPERILPNVVVAKIASGGDHLVCLTAAGDIYTMGAADQGQLGRVAECFSVRGGRKGIELLLVPSIVKCSRRNQKFSDIWAGQYVTFAKAKDSGDIYAWGLNNYYQLGFPDMRNKFVPEKSVTFEKSKDWKEISSGEHHTVALDKDGLVYSLGRMEYGRLGLGSENLAEKSAPTLVATLQDKKCVNVNCGSFVSFAVDDEGKIYGWGMGSINQLGQGDDESDIYEPKHITSKLLDDKRGLMVSAGGQHTIFLAQVRS